MRTKYGVMSHAIDLCDLKNGSVDESSILNCLKRALLDKCDLREFSKDAELEMQVVSESGDNLLMGKITFVLTTIIQTE